MTLCIPEKTVFSKQTIWLKKILLQDMKILRGDDSFPSYSLRKTDKM